jgi:DNA-binding NarL/FixJ family response regulator
MRGPAGADAVSKGYAEAGRLTPRMVEVLSDAAEGRTVIETARRLALAEATVWSVRAAVCARLDAPNVTAAVVLAIRRGEL